MVKGCFNYDILSRLALVLLRGLSLKLLQSHWVRSLSGLVLVACFILNSPHRYVDICLTLWH